MQVELIASYEGLEVYGVVEHATSGDRIYYKGSKVDVLVFFLGMVNNATYYA